MSMKKKVEILAPAKNLCQGQMAINAGAHAVYIGAPQYGVRFAGFVILRQYFINLTLILRIHIKQLFPWL